MKRVVELFGGPGDGSTVKVAAMPYPTTIRCGGVRYWISVECATGTPSYRIDGWWLLRR